MRSLFLWVVMQGMLVGVYWFPRTSYQSYLQGLTLEGGTDKLPWNISKQLPTYPAQQCRGVKTADDIPIKKFWSHTERAMLSYTRHRLWDMNLPASLLLHSVPLLNMYGTLCHRSCYLSILFFWTAAVQHTVLMVPSVLHLFWAQTFQAL